MKNPFKDDRPPEELTHDELRQRIIDRNRWTLAEAEQFIRDVQWWNNNRTEHPPMDCEDVRLIRANCISVLKQMGAYDGAD